MSHKYFYSEKRGEFIFLSKEDGHHLVRALRIKIGDEITVSNGEGVDYLCKVVETDPVKLKTEIELPPQLQRREVSMYISLAKGDKLALMLQKCTELGAEHFYLFETENSDARADNIEFKLERFNRIITEAAKQCGRSTLPDVCYLNSIDTALERCDGDVFICHEKATKRLAEQELPDKLSLFIGPEGGFSEQEVQKVIAKGGRSVSISNNILRCETAAITAVAIALEG